MLHSLQCALASSDNAVFLLEPRACKALQICFLPLFEILLLSFDRLCLCEWLSGVQTLIYLVGGAKL